MVLAYPRIANFDDFDPLRLEKNVDLVFLRPGEPIPGDAALVILPGSKATIADLAALRAAGWDIDLKAHVRRGGHVLGICGGYQMLGRRIADPDGIEGPAGSVEGLGLLEVDTVLDGDKVLVEITGETVARRRAVQGLRDAYRPDHRQPLVRCCASPTASTTARSTTAARVAGCYIHGLLADDRQRQHWLQRIGVKGSALDYEADVDATLDRLADHIEKYLDCDRLLALAREPKLKTSSAPAR